MQRHVAAITLLAAACASNTKPLERKVDALAAQLATTQRELAELRARIDQPAAPSRSAQLERKLEDLQMKLDAVKTDLKHANPAPMVRRPEPSKDKTFAIKAEGHPSTGPADAKVTLVFAYDYASPFAEKSRETLAALRTKYGNDLRVVYRTLLVHPRIVTVSAMAACAADKQKKFPAFDALLWDKGFNQRQYDEHECWQAPKGCPIVLGFAKELKLNTARFKADMLSCEAEVAADTRELSEAAIHATPTSFINGRFLQGAQPLENFAALIDEELAKATERITAGTPKASYYKEWVIGKGLPRVEP
jgi:protein-disulfide isomerase